MNYRDYEKISERIMEIELQMGELSVELIQEQDKLYESQKIGFRMQTKEDGRKFNKGNFKGPGPGRPKGSKNKHTKDIIDRVKRVLDLLEETLEDDIKKLRPSERARMWESLQEYVRPKLQRSEIKADIKGGPVKIGFSEDSTSE